MVIRKLKGKVDIYRILALIIPLVLSVIWYWYQSFYPVSNLSFLTSDLAQQYRGFFMYFKQFLEGKVSLQYSWQLFGGSNMIGIFPYYLGSIFNLVLVFFKESQLYAGIATILLLKVLATGETSYLYFKSILKKQPLSAIALSVCFTFSGMLVGYFFNIIWLDAFVYLPLVILGLNQLIITNKLNWLFIISLTLLLISNFYMAYMVGLLTLIWLFAQIFNSRMNGSRAWEVIIKYGISALITLGLGAIVIFPTLMQLSHVQKHGFTWHTDWLYSGFSFLGKLFNGVYYPASYIDVDQTGSVYPHIYSGIIAIVLLGDFFLLKRVDFRRKISYGLILLLLIISLLWYPMSIVWHGFNEPTGFPFRFAYLLSFVLLTMAAETLKEITKEDIVNLVYSNILISLIWGVIAWTIPSISLGIWWWNQLLIIVIVLLISSFVTNGNREYGVQVILLVVICMLDVGINSNLVTSKMAQQNNFNNYKDKYYFSADQDDAMKNAIKAIKTREHDNSRIVRIRSNYKDFPNASLYYGYPSIKGFSSMLDTNYRKLMLSLGNQSTRVSIKTGGNLIGTILLNEAYEIQPFYKNVDKDFPIIVEKNKSLTIAKRDITMPTGISVNDKNMTRELDNNSLEQLIKVMGGNPGRILRTTKMTGLKQYNINNNDHIYSKKGNGEAKLIYSVPPLNKDELAYLSINTPFTIKGVYLKNGNQVDALQTGDTLINPETKTIEFSWSENQKIVDYAMSFTIINQREWAALVKKHSNSQHSLKIDKISKKSFEGHIEKSSSMGKELILIPYDSGWKFSINGEVVSPKRILDDFMLVKVPKNQNDVKVIAHYCSPGFKTGSLITTTTLMIIVSWYHYSRKKRNKDANKI